MSGGVLSSEVSLLGRQTAAFLLCLRVFFLPRITSRNLLQSDGTQAPPSRLHFNLIALSDILRFFELGLEHMNLEGTQFSS